MNCDIIINMECLPLIVTPYYQLFSARSAVLFAWRKLFSYLVFGFCDDLLCVNLWFDYLLKDNVICLPRCSLHLLQFCRFLLLPSSFPTGRAPENSTNSPSIINKLMKWTPMSCTFVGSSLQSKHRYYSAKVYRYNALIDFSALLQTSIPTALRLVSCTFSDLLTCCFLDCYKMEKPAQM